MTADTRVSPIALAMPVACAAGVQSLLVISLPAILTLTGLSVGTLSPVLGVAALGYLVGGYFWPRRVSAGGRRQLLQRLLAAAFLSKALFVGTLLAASAGWLSGVAVVVAVFTTRLGYALTVSGVFPTIQAWLAGDYEAADRHGAFTRLSAAVNGVRLFIPLLAAALVLRWPEAALALLMALPLTALLVLPRERMAAPAPSASHHPLRRLPEPGVALPAILTNMSLGMAEFVIAPFLASAWGIGIDSTPVYTALLLTSSATCMVVTQLITLRHQPDPRALLVWGPMAMAVGGGISAIFPPALPLGLVLVAAALALVAPATSTAAVAGRDNTDHARAGSDLYTARILGHLLGVTMAGPLFELAPRLPLAAAALVALAAIPASAGLRRALAHDDSPGKPQGGDRAGVRTDCDAAARGSTAPPPEKS
ncbi:MFS transporter [Arhodomonas sp. AD133]|uniref:MFS transporter n=1 Tax=Arhodomonas sp. AD133 TaxID=3415009 RepID=UPI003EBBC93A